MVVSFLTDASRYLSWVQNSQKHFGSNGYPAHTQKEEAAGALGKKKVLPKRERERERSP